MNTKLGEIETSWARKGIILLGMILLVAGCGSKLPTTAPVSGTVLLDGKPVEGAAVSLVPNAGGRFGYGTTDAQGKFTISTYGDNDGATLGGHKILVTKADIIPPTKAAATIEDQEELLRGGGAGWTFKSHIPEKYGSPDKTDLTVEVAVGLEPLELKLSSK
jgi:hypothetical protein